MRKSKEGVTLFNLSPTFEIIGETSFGSAGRVHDEKCERIPYIGKVASRVECTDDQCGIKLERTSPKDKDQTKR